MLVLKRKSDEEIVIGSDIKIKVIDVGNGKVTLGISADKKKYKIVRHELLQDPKIAIS